MRLSELAELLNATLEGNDAVFSSISNDTRELEAGQLYIALKGEQFDGHDFLKMATEKKAVAAIVATDAKLSIPTIKVIDTRLALGKVAAFHRARFDLPVIGVTGSCGKTTIKAMLANILNQMGPTLSPIKSFNNDIGVPLTLLQLTNNHRYAVIEMGANHPHEITYLSSLAKQTVAVISNVGPAHLAGFGNLEGVARAKGEIYEALPPRGIAIINNDDQFASFWKSKLMGREIITFGLRTTVDVTARNIILTPEGKPQFELVYSGGRANVNLPTLGRHNVMNALAATAAGYAVGATLSAIVTGLNTVDSVTKRLIKYKGLNGSFIIDDSYNANPLSVIAALEALAHYEGEKIFVFGGMGELGPEEISFHTQIGKKAKDLNITRLYACGDLAKHSVLAFGESGFHFSDQGGLISALQPTLCQDTVVLVKGSRTSRMENIVKALIQEI